MSFLSHVAFFVQRVSRRFERRALLAGVVGLVTVAVIGLGLRARAAETASGLRTATDQLATLGEGSPGDDRRRPAVMWGYAERQRLGIESPFRLIELAASDARLTADQQRTVSWALLARVLRGESHEVDAAALDLLGPWTNDRSVSGEQHLALITTAIHDADDPRAGELAVRFAYTLAASERLVDGAAPLLTSEAAALIADREIARREAKSVIRSTNSADPIQVVRARRAKRQFYVERPVLLSPDHDIETAAIAATGALMDALRAMRPSAVTQASDSTRLADDASVFAPRLFAAGARMPPAAPLAVTAQRYLPLVRAQMSHVADAVGRARNPEMLVAALATVGDSRAQRRVSGRLVLAAAVAMRSMAQEPVGPAIDTTRLPDVAATIGAAGVAFDTDVPRDWHPYFERSLIAGIADMRRVLPGLDLSGVRIRFRMTSPADSALAMHDPRTRTLHLPVASAAGTLVHEIAHDLDRQSALSQGISGYRSDHVARTGGGRAATGGDRRVAASLRTLTDELTELPRGTQGSERPAEIFATRVDWFVAAALARKGISSGFLTAVQDELLTGHAVHPERLRSVGRSRSLLNALEGMTTVAPFASIEPEPSAQTLLRWALAGPIDRRVASDIVRGASSAWRVDRFFGQSACNRAHEGRVELLRLAAESRARGWLRLRARWTPDGQRASWAHGALGSAPWSTEAADRRVAELRDYVLLELSAGEELPAGIAAYARPLVSRAWCSKQ
jgi:hypothetical protein